MPESYWRTYTGPQALQVSGGLQVLKDTGTLDEKEEETADKIMRKLSRAITKGENITMIPLTAEEDDLVQKVESALWR